jgi:hypothetical protein
MNDSINCFQTSQLIQGKEMRLLFMIATVALLTTGCIGDDDQADPNNVVSTTGNADASGNVETSGNSQTSANSDTTGNTGNSQVVTNPSPFVSVDPGAPRFLLMGEAFYFAGTNLFWLPQQHVYGSAAVDDAFDAAEDVGLTVIRVWGFADGAQWTNSDDPAII